MPLNLKPLATATQQAIYFQPRRDGISPGAKLAWLVGILTLSLFGSGFFATLFANSHRHRSFTPHNPLANRASRRDICTDIPTGLPTGHELTLVASHVLGSHYLARGADGKYLQTWIDPDPYDDGWWIYYRYNSRYRLIDAGFNPSGVVVPPYLWGSGEKTAGIGWKGGNYDLFAASNGGSLYIEWIPISSAGVAGNNSLYNYTSGNYQYSVPLLSLTSLPSGEAAVCTSDGITSDYSYPFLHIFTSSATRTTYKVDTAPSHSTLISCSALGNNNIAYFWKDSSKVYGMVVTKTNNVIVAKKTILLLTTSALTSTVLANQKVVLAWVDSTTSKVAFQIMDATLSNASAVIVADPCSSGIQTDPQLMNFWDGFVLVLTSDDESGKGVYGYRFGPDGMPIGGRFPLNSSTAGDQTNPVIAPLGSSGIYTGWSSTDTTLISRPFDFNRAPFANGLIPPQSALTGNLFNLNLAGYIQDPDTSTGFDNLTYSLFNSPPWLSFNPETLIASGMPGNSSGTIETIIFRGVDFYGKSANQTFTITTNNKPPYIAWQPDNAKLALSSYFYLPVSQIFIDPEGSPVDVSVSGNPSWLIFTNQALTGIASEIGISTLNITGTDPLGASSVTSFTIEVDSGIPGNHPPQVNTAIPSITEKVETPFTYSIPSDAFIDLDQDPLVYQASLPGNNPLPSWLLFDQEIGSFSGHPRTIDAGEYLIVVKAIDTSGASALQTFMLTIRDTTNLPPYVASPMPATTAFVGQLFQLYVEKIFADPNEGDVVTLSASFSPAVTWISFDSSKGSLSGTPGHGDVFPVSAILIGRDQGGLSATSTLIINVQGDNWFIYLFKIVGPIFSVLGALVTVYRYRDWIKDKALLLKRTISPITTPQIGIALNPIPKESDSAPLLEDAYKSFNDANDNA